MFICLTNLLGGGAAGAGAAAQKLCLASEKNLENKKRGYISQYVHISSHTVDGRNYTKLWCSGALQVVCRQNMFWALGNQI